jgi:predicted Zn finger-like uncharacterized protein
MILTCPNCATRYQTDASIAAPGRNVRCAKCGQVWFQSPPEPEPEPALESELEMTESMATSDAPEVAHHAHEAAVEESPAYSHDPREAERQARYEAHRQRAEPGTDKPRPGFAKVAGWIVLIVIIIAIIFAIISYRQSIALMWPQTSSMYATIGLPVNVLGLDLRDVTPAQTFDAGQPQLEVSGRVVNVAKHRIPVPHVRVALYDGEQREIYRWTFDSGVGTLAPGAGGGFTTRLASPPREAKNVSVRFVDAGEQ